MTTICGAQDLCKQKDLYGNIERISYIKQSLAITTRQICQFVNYNNQLRELFARSIPRLIAVFLLGCCVQPAQLAHVLPQTSSTT